jgi:hypothetical protein
LIGAIGPSWSWDDSFWSEEGADWSLPGQLSILIADPRVLPFTDDTVYSGELCSSIAYIPMGTDWSIEWGDILWNCYEPDSTDIYFQLRTGNDPDSMSAWGEPIYESGTCLGDLQPDDIFLIQYRVVLETCSDDPDTRPVLYDITVEGRYPGGIGGDPAGVDPGPVLCVLGNPGPGSVLLSLSNPLAVGVKLDVFDLSGRLVSQLFSGELAGGGSEFVFAGPPGTYLARLVSGIAEEKIVFILID